MNQTFDAIVLGAGVAAYAASIKLAIAGAHVLTVGSGQSHDRIETLAPHAAGWLDHLGIAAGVPFERVTAWWGSNEEHHRSYAGARAVQHTELLHALRDKALALKVSVHNVARCEMPVRSSTSWRIDSEAGSAIAHCAIDATGRRSLLGHKMGARRSAEHELFSISVSAATEGLAGTWTETVPGGWWNLASCGSRASIAFYSGVETIRRVRGVFPALLSQARHLDRLVLNTLGVARVHACGSSLLQPSAGPGWVAVGDAAATVQPLASAGIARAFQDADALPRALSNPSEYSELHRSGYAAYLRALSWQYRRLDLGDRQASPERESLSESVNPGQP
jgi:flavin-dependent dehydrogenase